jgi:hypothetical protein
VSSPRRGSNPQRQPPSSRWFRLTRFQHNEMRPVPGPVPRRESPETPQFRSPHPCAGRVGPGAVYAALTELAKTLRAAPRRTRFC